MRKNKKIIASILLFIMMTMPFMNLKVKAEETDQQIKEGFYNEVQQIVDENLNKAKLSEYGVAYEFNTKTGDLKLIYGGDENLTYSQFNGTGSVVTVAKILEQNEGRKYEVKSITINGTDADRTTLDQLEELGALKAAIASEIVEKLAPGKDTKRVTVKEILEKEAELKMQVFSKENQNKAVELSVKYIINGFSNMKNEAINKINALENLSEEEKKTFIDSITPLKVEEYKKIAENVTKAQEEDARVAALKAAKKAALDEIKAAGLESEENTEKIEAGKTPEEVTTIKEEILKAAALEAAKQKALEELEKEGITTEEATEEIVGAGTEEEVEEIKNKLIEDKKAEDLADAKAAALKEIKDKKVSKEVLEKAMSEINDAKSIEEVEKLKAKYLKEEKGAKTPKTGSNIVLAGVVFAIAAVSMYKIKNEK